MSKNKQKDSLGIAYQIYVPSFMDSKDDGVGDLSGIHERLDYLSELGVDVVILSPLYAMPSTENEKNTLTADRTKVLSIYGTASDLKRLATKAHRMGIRLLMDIDIDLDVEPTEYTTKVLNGWLANGFDGFRLNLANPLDSKKRSGEEAVAVHRKMAEIKNGLSPRSVILAGVVRDGYDGLAYLAGSELSDIGVTAMTNPPKHFGRDKWFASAVQGVVDLRQHTLIGTEDYLSARTSSRLGSEITKALLTMLFTLPASPCLYQGQELGLYGDKAIDSRRPMPWANAEQAGFSGGQPWLEVDSANPAMTVEAEEKDKQSALNYCRKLIELRKSALVLSRGALRLIENEHRVVSYVRTLGDSAAMIYLNLSSAKRKLAVPVVGSRILISSHVDAKIGANNLRPGEAIVTISD